jgi:hypothetical protein
LQLQGFERFVYRAASGLMNIFLLRACRFIGSKKPLSISHWIMLNYPLGRAV